MAINISIEYVQAQMDLQRRNSMKAGSMRQRISIHLEKHYLPCVKNLIFAVYTKYVTVLSYFSMLSEKAGNAFSEYGDCTEEIKQNSKENKVRAR